MAPSIGILAAIAIPLYANIQGRAAVSIYSAHMGTLPSAFSALNSVATNSLGQTADPFMGSTPAPPAGWAAHAYSPTTAGTFTVSSSGDNTTVSLP
jgi:hypothetical protein